MQRTRVRHHALRCGGRGSTCLRGQRLRENGRGHLIPLVPGDRVLRKKKIQTKCLNTNWTATKMHKHINTDTHMHTHNNTHTHIHTHIHTCTRTCTHTYTHIYTHVHAHVHTHANTHTCGVTEGFSHSSEVPRSWSPVTSGCPCHSTGCGCTWGWASHDSSAPAG